MPKFRVLPGGLSEDGSRYKYIDGQVTNTRLMGVLVMHLIWEDSAAADKLPIHQFLYFDYEETGLETIKVYCTDDRAEINTLCTENYAGLGSQLVDLDEADACWLVNFFVEDTKRRKILLPANMSDIGFILKRAPRYTDAQIRRLQHHISVYICSDYGVVNYYLMRIFGKDPEGAELLAVHSRGGRFDDPSFADCATFLRNRITPEEPAGEKMKTFRCESLVEFDAHHYIIVTELDVWYKKVIGIRELQRFEISDIEGSMLLSKSEYVSIYEINADPEEFRAALAALILGATNTIHPNGEMFMEFKPDNMHVEEQTFFLADDVQTLYFVSEGGQLLIAAYDLPTIISAETNVALSPVGSMIICTNRYQFQHSLLYDFAESDYLDFNEFLQSLQ